MGMYDYFEIEFECPYCHQKSLMKFQTKDLDNRLRKIEIGELVNVGCIEVVGDCHSPECQARADKYSCSFQQMASGFGALFDAQIEIKNKIITGNIINVVIQECYTDKYLESIKTKWAPYYHERSKKWFEGVWEKK